MLSSWPQFRLDKQQDGTQASWKQHRKTSLKTKTLSHDGNSYRRHAFSDRGMVEISRITGVPFAVLVFEVELHEMTSDRSHEHIARLCADGVGEFKDLVIRGATIAHSKVVVRQNSSHRLGHRWLLRHIQNSNRSRHLQASSPQNSQPKENPKKNPPFSALKLLHCSRRCDSELFSLALQRKLHRSFASFAWNSSAHFATLSSESGVGALVLRFGRSWFGLRVYLAGKRKGSTSGYQYRYSVHSDRTGGYKFTSISSFFFSFLGTNEKLHWEEDSVSFKIYLRRNVCDLRRVLDEKGWNTKNLP